MGLFLSVWVGFVWLFSDLIVYVAGFVEWWDLDGLVFCRVTLGDWMFNCLYLMFVFVLGYC